MEDLQLPHELQRLERYLARGPRPAPSAALQRRVLRGVRSELHNDMRSELRGRRTLPTWRLVTAFAASFLVWLSLSLGVLQATGFALQQRDVSLSVSEVAWRLQQLSPGLSREESLRQATLRQIGAEVSCATPLGDIPTEQECHDP